VHKTAVICGTLSLLLAVTIFLLAGGARRCYSSALFLVIGTVLLTEARNRKGGV
jgi:hypothetical protein